MHIKEKVFIILHQNGKYFDAIIFLDKELKINPNDFQAYLLKGECF